MSDRWEFDREQARAAAYRDRAIAAATAKPDEKEKPGTPTAVVVGAVIVLLLFFLGATDSTSTSNSGRSQCEQLWEENKTTAAGPHMWKSRYIENCEKSNDWIAENYDDIKRMDEEMGK